MHKDSIDTPSPIIGAIPDVSGARLTQLTPDEIVAAYGYAGNIEAERHKYPDTRKVARQVDLFRALDPVLQALPEQDVQFGRSVYTAFSESADWANRSMVALWIPCLARVDHDTGLRLWDRLIRDEEPAVRDSAESHLTEGLLSLVSGSRERADEQLSAVGLTALDALGLFRGYEAIRRGEAPYLLGDSARVRQQAPTVGAAALHQLLATVTSRDDG